MELLEKKKISEREEGEGIGMREARVWRKEREGKKQRSYSKDFWGD